MALRASPAAPLSPSPGNWLIILGILLVLVGLIVKTGLFSWFGHLPGDLAIRRDGFRFYFPVTSMIVVSVILSLLLSLARRIF